MNRTVLARIGGMAAVAALVLLLGRAGWAVPTPRMSDDEAQGAADLAVEGRIIGVVLVKHWIGDRPGIDQGYEQGDFKSWVLVTKTLKGGVEVNDTVEVFVHAYKEGKWAERERFVYEGTGAAITPGNKVRFYLKYNAEQKRYERVHFNSGFELIEESKQKHPSEVGRPAMWAEAGKDGVWEGGK